ncbi:MAG TPA: hypothetical protein VHE09_11805 [Rhizomicrobium sp.]|jgi:hypothetical protein|nr:hypothetical protein [Rhizomicrobium sp.]
MYGPYVRDKFPARKHLSTILDIEPGHSAGHAHILLWLLTAIIAASAIASWYFGFLPH